MSQYRLDASPETVRWGHFDAVFPPVLTVNSGDTIIISTATGDPEQLPPANSSLTIPDSLLAIHEKVERKLGPHICTGPIAMRGAKPGDVLEVRIQTIELAYDWGFNQMRTGFGALPEDFGVARNIIIPLDRERMVGRLPWKEEIPLRPFFGVMGVAPPAHLGTVSSSPPRHCGGNMDNKELVAGTTLYLPIQVDDALFSVGDGHAVQGDGEVCQTALETGLIGTFELHLHKGWSLEWPIAETSTHWITMGFDPDLNLCVKIALREMIKLICSRTGISRENAYTLCSLAADLRVSQVVNGSKGIHVMLEKRYFGRSSQSMV
jgi:acetamidase/formamidase